MPDILPNFYITIPLTLTIGVVCGWFLYHFLNNKALEAKVVFLEEKLRQKADEAYLAKNALEKARFGLNSLTTETSGLKPDLQILSERNAEIIMLKAEIDLLKSSLERSQPKIPREKPAKLHLVEDLPKPTNVRQAVRNRLAALKRTPHLGNIDTHNFFPNEEEAAPRKTTRKSA